MRRTETAAKARFEKTTTGGGDKWSDGTSPHRHPSERAQQGTPAPASTPEPICALLGRRRAASRIKMAFLLLLHLAAPGQEHAPLHASPAPAISASINAPAHTRAARPAVPAPSLYLLQRAPLVAYALPQRGTVSPEPRTNTPNASPCPSSHPWPSHRGRQDG